ncbi:RNA recognition domain-containing protein, partial [Diaporthe helianthi]
FGEGVTEIQTTPTVTHLSFSDRKQAELFYDGFKTGTIQGINDADNNGAGVELSWVSGPAAALPGSTTSSVNLTGGGGGELDSAMDDVDGGDAAHHHHDGEDGKDRAHGESESHAHHRQQQNNEQQSQQQQQQQQQQHQHEGGEPKEVDYDVAGENEWDE